MAQLDDKIRREIELAESDDGYILPCTCTMPVDDNGKQADCDGQCDGCEYRK